MSLINKIKVFFGLEKKITKPQEVRHSKSKIIHSTNDTEPLMRHLDNIIDKHHY